MPIQQYMWMDFFIFSIIIVSFLLGLGRGFIREAISLSTWIAAFILAFTLVDEATAYLSAYIDMVSLRIVLAFGMVFSLTVSLGGLINLLVTRPREHEGVTSVDRVLAGGIGLVRGVAASALVVLLAGLTPLPEDLRWSHSPVLVHFQEAALWLRGFLPQALAVNFRFP